MLCGLLRLHDSILYRPGMPHDIATHNQLHQHHLCRLHQFLRPDLWWMLRGVLWLYNSVLHRSGMSYDHPSTEHYMYEHHLR